MLSRRFALVVFLSLAGAWLLARILKDSVIDLARVTNESMLPYLKPGVGASLANSTGADQGGGQGRGGS